MTVREIGPAELKDRLASDDPPLVLDVREDWELDEAAFPGARHVSLAALVDESPTLPRDRTIVVLCHHGGRSYSAAMMLDRAGFDAVNLAGGIAAWSRDVDPSVPQY